LYPDTYKVNINNFKINEFVIKQLETFETKVYNKILKSYDVDTITDVVNLASIVENEEQNPEEKATVAGILKKRLNSSWMI
jgi:cell division protein YceG involved in septum cleavage